VYDVRLNLLGKEITGDFPENTQISPRPPFGLPDALVAVLTLAAVLQEGRKYANIHARSGVI
jgi:hypothetical protein